MKPQRKLSDGILPCGRCGGRPQKYWDAYWEYFRGMSLRCRDCGLAALKGYTEENAESLWNNLSAKTHPEPEDYLELLREGFYDWLAYGCPPSASSEIWWRHRGILHDLFDEFGDDDD